MYLNEIIHLHIIMYICIKCHGGSMKYHGTYISILKQNSLTAKKVQPRKAE